MNHSDRGPLLLILAGILLILAVVAYSIRDAEESYRRRAREADIAYSQNTAIFVRIVTDHAEVMDSLHRIEKAIEAKPSR